MNGANYKNPMNWHTVTGRDFGRSIRWARTQAPTLRELINEAARRIAEHKKQTNTDKTL